MKFLSSLCVLLSLCCIGFAQQKLLPSPIYNGVPWFDNNGDIVNAHGACIVEDEGKYYLFGEYKTDSVNTFIGFSCYSSTDLVNWTFERLALPMQKSGPLGPDRIGERVKVMKSSATGEYVMYMHTDDKRYRDPQVGYATSKTINGEYTFQGPLLYEGKPIRKWDMGTFQDHDGTGYLLVHHGDIYRLSDDFRSAEKKVASGISGSGESPAMFKRKDTYYLLSSSLTSWERNDNIYHTATKIEGPWTKQGLFCPEGTLTHNSQCSFVLSVKRERDTLYMYMGDRWSFPKQGQAATQVWLPLQAHGTELRIPTYWEAWDFQAVQPIPEKPPIGLPGNQQLQSNRKGDFVTIPYDGASIGLLGTSTPDGGYALISIVSKEGDTVRSSLVDFYSRVPHTGLRYITPKLPTGDYTLNVEVAGEQGVWYNKRGDRFGSKGFWVRIHDIVLLDADNWRAAQEYILPSDNHNNPVIHGYYADPEILYAEKTGKYYLYPTSDGFHGWSGYRFKVFSSDNLKDWKDEGVMLDLKRDAPWAAANAWAPCIIEKKT
ncbi:MAG TPA: family 43 glycosylhydrolase, partial [Sphingobacterium sp.]|nr:family 43 glycosylhydrolase [Sphingobacterium sp.]